MFFRLVSLKDVKPEVRELMATSVFCPVLKRYHILLTCLSCSKVTRCDVPAKYGVDSMSLDDVFLDAKYVVAVSPVDRSRSVRDTLTDASRRVKPVPESDEKPVEKPTEREESAEKPVEKHEEAEREVKEKRASKGKKDAILAYSKQHPDAKPKQIAEALGCRVDYVRQVLRNAKKKNNK